jgi:putative hydrolase of the HAD superfamily
MRPKFIYFDLGNVLLRFDRQRQIRQMAEAAGTTPEKAKAAFFKTGIYEASERGELTTEQMFERFCAELGVECNLVRLRHAVNDIFWPNFSMIPVISALWSAGWRLGILSNTCASHWEFASDDRYSYLSNCFEVLALSYEVGVMKPDHRIYEAAAEKAGVAPDEILFTDDLAENVAGAREASFDAVVYSTTAAFVRELRSRGVEFSY